MTFWRGEKLQAKVAASIQAGKGGIIEPFDPKQIDCNAYTLRMGDRFFCTADHERSEAPKKIQLTPGQSFLIPPGQFAYLLTRESIRIPTDAMAFISMRTSTKFAGLINVSGFHVDPGYEGKLLYAVFNASPSAIHLCEGDELFKIWFCDLDAQSSMTKGPGDGVSDISNELIRGMDGQIYSLQRLAEKVVDLSTEMETRFAEQKPTLDTLNFIYRAFIIGVLVAVAVAVMPVAWENVKSANDWVWQRISTSSSTPEKTDQPELSSDQSE